MSCKLFTTYWPEPNAVRRCDLVCALAANCHAFQAVWVLSQDEERAPIEAANCHWYPQTARQTFADLLWLARRMSHDGDVVVVANSDIWIPADELARIDRHLADGEVYCLSRWDLLARGVTLFDRRDSQDTWIFRGPPRSGIGGLYPFGYPGVDNRLAHELDAAGYRVLNPARDVRTYHVHPTPHRNDNKPENRVPLPYLLVEPHRLDESPVYHRPTTISRNAGHFQR